MRPPIQDPTARAPRAIREDAAAPELVRDPMDPRCGHPLRDTGERAGDARRVFDPTNPDCGAVH